MLCVDQSSQAHKEKVREAPPQQHCTVHTVQSAVAGTGSGKARLSREYIALLITFKTGSGTTIKAVLRTGAALQRTTLVGLAVKPRSDC